MAGIFNCSNVIYVASSDCIWRLTPRPITSQIRQLLQNKEFELALQLAVRFVCMVYHKINNLISLLMAKLQRGMFFPVIN